MLAELRPLSQALLLPYTFRVYAISLNNAVVKGWESLSSLYNNHPNVLRPNELTQIYYVGGSKSEMIKKTSPILL